MRKKEEDILELLEESLPVFSVKEVTAKTKNGIPVKELLDVEKKVFLLELLEGYEDKIISYTQEYPKKSKDILGNKIEASKVTLVSDFYIISKKKLQLIKDILNGGTE